MTRNKFVISILFLGVLLGIIYLTQPSDLPTLYTEGDKIMRADTGEPIILRGIVSDYFRYDFNYDYPEKSGGLKTELERIDQLQEMGADINMVGLYLARLDKTKANIEEMDQYIEYASDHGMYVFLAPAGIGFLETNPKKEIKTDEEYWRNVGPNDLAELTEFLADRYGNFSNVMYQLTAEPGITSIAWRTKQRELAEIVRKYTDNPIIVSTPLYVAYPSLPILPFKNIIYSTGGYVSRVDTSFVERTTEGILWTTAGKESSIKNYPIIVAEFGGNYGGDFSTMRDLELFKNLLEAIQDAGLSHTAYRFRREPFFYRYRHDH